MADREGRAGRSAAWGVSALLFGAVAVAAWQVHVSPHSKVPIWPVYGFGVVAAGGLYMCFATLEGWWPARRSVPSRRRTLVRIFQPFRLGTLRTSRQKRTVETVGQCNPFDLGVHRALAPSGVMSLADGPQEPRALTLYVKRDHDKRLHALLRSAA